MDSEVNIAPDSTKRTTSLLTSEPNSQPASLFEVMLAEAFGTFLLVFFGCGVVHAAVLLDAQSGVWQIAIVWGIAIMLASYCVGNISGAHINPAITIAFSIFGRHSWSRVIPYIASQVAGAFVASALLFFLFSGFIRAKELEKGVVRGEPGSIVTAMCYGEYFPSPGSLASKSGLYDATEHAQMRSRIGLQAAWLAEFIGTMILSCVVFAVTDDRNPGKPIGSLPPVFIGLTVSALISVLAPLTQAGFNPARDFGPRLFAYIAGWGNVAIPGLSDTSWMTVYIVAPILGAIAGATFYQFVLRQRTLGQSES